MELSAMHPLAYYGALSSAMCACLYLFVSTAQQVECLKKRFDGRSCASEQEISRLGTQMASLETRLAGWAGRTNDLEETVSGLAAVRRMNIPTNGVNSNQRTQVLRMARRGERADQIAAELRIPKNEVDLLLKVQRAVVRVF
jgi:hypothetical protein